jgi:type VI secretion system secreted protein VgrG
VLGDPDRPIIVGAVPNPQTPSPVTRDNATQSLIRTSSGIHMEFEDDA